MTPVRQMERWTDRETEKNDMAEAVAAAAFSFPFSFSSQEARVRAAVSHNILTMMRDRGYARPPRDVTAEMLLLTSSSPQSSSPPHKIVRIYRWDRGGDGQGGKGGDKEEDTGIPPAAVSLLFACESFRLRADDLRCISAVVSSASSLSVLPAADTTALILTNGGVTAYTLPLIAALTAKTGVAVELWTTRELQFNPVLHVLAAPHVPLVGDELAAFRARIDPADLPVLLASDAIARHYAFPPGTVVRIDRALPGVAPSPAYRVVAGSPS